MTLRVFISSLALDILILVLALTLRFVMLADLPIDWNSVLVSLFFGFFFVIFVLINIIIALIRRSFKSQSLLQQARTIKITAETKPVIIILLSMAIIGLLAALTAALTNLDSQLGANISSARIISNFLLAIIYLSLIAPWVTTWAFLSINTKG